MSSTQLQIRRDDLRDPRIALFLEQHIRDMRAVSPPQSKHALDLDGLRQPDIRFWSAWDGEQLIGCGAHGFETCAPFGDYREDPNSVFMTRVL